jgi:hypothetical protein
VQLAVNNLGDEVVRQPHQAVVRRGTIERRHSRHWLHHTSSDCTDDAEGGWRNQQPQPALNSEAAIKRLQILR